MSFETKGGMSTFRVERRCAMLYFNKILYLLIHFLCNYEGDISIRKKKGA